MESVGCIVPFNWSPSVIATTVIVVTVLLLTIFLLIFNTKGQKWGRYSLSAFLIIVLIGSSIFIPISLKSSAEEIKINFSVASISIPRESIITIKRIESSATAGSKRTFGSGGAFGHLGKFRNSELGDYIMFATEKDNRVLIQTTDKKYVVSCRDIDALTNPGKSNIEE